MGVLEVESHIRRYGDRRPREEERKKTRKTQKHMKQEQLNMRQESRVKPLVEPTSVESQLLVSHLTVKLQVRKSFVLLLLHQTGSVPTAIYCRRYNPNSMKVGTFHKM